MQAVLCCWIILLLHLLKSGMAKIKAEDVSMPSVLYVANAIASVI